MNDTDIKINIEQSIAGFAKNNLFDAAKTLLNSLGYKSDKTLRLSPNNFSGLAQVFDITRSNFKQDKALVSDWKSVEIIFQLGDDDLSSQNALFDTKSVDNKIIESFLFIAIELKNGNYNRSTLAAITREVNKLTSMPAIIIFKCNNFLTISIIDRRLHKRDESKDVLEKVTLIKDILIPSPKEVEDPFGREGKGEVTHRAHIEILFDLSFEHLKAKHNFTNFVELHEAWQKTLDTKELNKKFFQELANWYFWAISKTNWPDDDEQLKKKEVRNATNVIRLITRLIFIWFLKEKKLVDDILFNERELKSILNNSDSNESTYYKAILQNLFFSTLNTPLDKRTFRTKHTFQGKNEDRGNPFKFRYETLFNKDIKELFEHIPFLNGGLFDCLDYKDEKGKMIHIDGFSEEKNNPIKVPDNLFFSEPEKIDLSAIYNDKKKSKAEVRGLINILDSYKFTVTENTPIEEEVALDPELLGRVFENLLAYYNPETETTARKQTGSFYTPREIVNYMVDESLIAYLSNVIPNPASAGEESANENEKRLRNLISYSEAEPDFNEQEKKSLIAAIDNIKVLDPACGSGAFPMGVLHKLVYILHRLDPQNQMWKQKQIDFASEIQEATARENALKNIEDVFNPANNYADYGRKLFLIRNCIYGVDIQPIAIQIAKLRFFISLLIDQSINTKKDNHNIDPLPNLESKFVCANTLIGLQKSSATGNLFDENYEKIVQLKAKFAEIRKNYFNVKLPQEKKKLHKSYLDTRDELIKILKKDKGFSVDAPLMVQYDPYNPLNVSPFFDVEWMFGFSGFDIVIGNPPYIDIKGLKKEDVNVYFKIFKTTENRINLYAIFIEKGISILNQNGILVYINPNSILINESYKKIRKHIVDGIERIIKLPDSVFDSATVETIILLSTKKSSSDNILGVCFANDDKIDFAKLSFNTFSRTEWKADEDSRFNIFSDSNENSLIKKIQTGSFPLENYVFTSLGITPYDKYKGHTEKLIRNREFHSPSKLTNKYVPLISGKNIHPYYISNEIDEYLKYGDWLGAPRDKKFFENPKIIVRQIVAGKELKIVAGYSEKPRYFTQIGFSLISKNDNKDELKFILGLLNSLLISYYHKYKFLDIEKVVFQKILIANCKKLPIKKPESQKSFVNLVDKILAVKSKNPETDTSALEKQIDELVYKLYDLTEEEIKIVEHQ